MAALDFGLVRRAFYGRTVAGLLVSKVKNRNILVKAQPPSMSNHTPTAGRPSCENVMNSPPQIPYRPARLPEEQMLARGAAFFEQMAKRRSVRQFSPDPVPRELIELSIRTAARAPSGANRQPWRFVAVDDPNTKREVRIAAEKVEHEFYEEGRASPEWLDAVAPMGTDWRKPFLETAPWLVVVFEQAHGFDDAGNVQKNYYVKESAGIACGLFIAALHNMGLATLPHTPSPSRFLAEILKRPDNERPSILFPVGYPADDATVPDLTRKRLEEVAVWNP